MKVRVLKMSLGAVFLVSLASLGAIVVFLSPPAIGYWGPVLFSAAVYFLFFSLAAWLGLKLRQKFITGANFRRLAGMSFRQGALAAVAVLGGLWLNRFNLFKVWTIAPMLILILAVEYLILIRVSKEKRSDKK